jgi:mono/diheme cytochrome c family protein
MFRVKLLVLIGVLLLLAGCATTMKAQPKYTPYSYSEFYPDHTSARQPPANTVARDVTTGQDQVLMTGMANGQPVTDFPFPMTADDLRRGETLFNGICAPCHDRAGTGNGVVVERGFTHPPTLHSDAIRNMPVGQLFDVITNGFGAMPSYGPILQPPDRWRVIAYIRALELSQNATLNDVPQDQRNQIKPPVGGQ